MGGHPYWYVVDYSDDLQGALETLRKREFTAGRYNPAMPFPLENEGPPPGAQHATIEEALEASMEDGTRSILDILSIGAEPDYCVAAPYTSDELQAILGTTSPTEAQANQGLSALLDPLERGKARYVILHEGGAPAKLMFLGYSFD